MSSMLWAAAAAAAPGPVSAEDLIERARSFYSIEQENQREVCPESSEEEIVVCREVGDPDRYRVPSDADRGVVRHEVPRAPNVSGLPDCSQATCIRVGRQPPQVNLIDLDAIPEAPPGSDADRIARGEMSAP